jgi:acetoin utilization deacetylase AcuC-like enzyme
VSDFCSNCLFYKLVIISFKGLSLPNFAEKSQLFNLKNPKAMKQRSKKIRTFYTDQQVCFDNIQNASFSKSPLKPYLLMQRIEHLGLNNLFLRTSQFEPFTKADFELAHTPLYVHNVFNGEGNYRSNNLPWSKNLVYSLGYTNAALYEAKKHALLHPQTICFAPVSGMHHAQPNRGSGFCTFSGQVISALKLYDEFGVSGAYFDLDGHYGNSIEDSRTYCPKLNLAIPKGCNVNPSGYNESYIQSFQDGLDRVEKLILAGKIHYVVFAHGADSHADDDIGGGCDTKHWLLCAEIFAEWVNTVSKKIGKPLPVTLALFGGYRADNYNAVLDLHLSSLALIAKEICGQEKVNANYAYQHPPKTQKVAS